jgi:hypothetical protein
LFFFFFCALRGGATLDSTMNLTTNTDKPRMISDLAQWVSKHAGGETRDILDRERIQVMNLLDLNVNPVNLNALRREVPLINMLNYAFTFDSFMKELLGLENVTIPNDNRGMFLELMLDPHMQKSSRDWDTIFKCYSDDSASLGFGGHDRFAQDQVFRKALLYKGKNIQTSNRVRVDKRSGYKYPDRSAPFGQHRDNLQRADIDPDQLGYLTLLGQARHDTTFIRNILFISSAQRAMRTRLQEKLTQINFPVVSGPPAVSLHVTDENVWETYDDVRRSYD